MAKKGSENKKKKTNPAEKINLHSKWKFNQADRVIVKKTKQKGKVTMLSSSNPQLEMRYSVQFDEGGWGCFSGDELARLKKKGEGNGASEVS